MAQMDSVERIWLKRALSRLESDLALGTCYTDDDCKIHQADWKRFDRHKDLFKQVLMSGKSLPAQPPIKPVRPAHQTTQSSQAVQQNGANRNAADRVNQTTQPNETPDAPPHLEMVLTKLPQAALKIPSR